MSDLLANDLMEVLTEDNERLTKELNDLHTKYTQLRDNSRLGSVVDKSCRRSLRECPILGCDQWFETPEEYHKHLDQIHCKRVYNVCDKRCVTQESLSRHETSFKHNVAVDSSGGEVTADSAANQLIPEIVLKANGSANETKRPSLRTSEMSQKVGTSAQLIQVLVPLAPEVMVNTSPQLSQQLVFGVKPSAVEELNEHTDSDHKVMSFVAFYESIGGQHSDTESTPEPHIHHINGESEDNPSQHLSHSEESNWSSDCERNITEDFNDINDGMDSISEDTHRENQLIVVSTNDKPIARDADIQTSGKEIGDNRKTGSNGSTIFPRKVTIDLDNSDTSDEDSDEYSDVIDGQSTAKPLQCVVNGCDFECEQRYQLRQHMSVGHEGVDLYPWPLPACGRLFRTADDLALHDSDPHLPLVGRPYIPPPTTTAGQLSGVSPPPDDRPNGSQYKCHYNGCEKVFTQLRDKVRHHFIHTGEKPLKCPSDGCDYRSYRYDLVKSHAKRHRMVEHSLNSHQLVHSDSRPHPCPHPRCNKRFKRLAALHNHSRRFHQ